MGASSRWPWPDDKPPRSRALRASMARPVGPEVMDGGEPQVMGDGERPNEADKPRFGVADL